jgi:hypothetical protein
MASTTATALIGVTHQNDSMICPSHLARLIEGDGACWILDDLGRRTPRLEWSCTSSTRVLPDLLGIVALGVLANCGTGLATPKPADEDIDQAVASMQENRRFALSITVFPESSLRGSLVQLESLANVDIDVSMPVWSKKWSAWTGTISAEGTLPGRADEVHTQR